MGGAAFDLIRSGIIQSVSRASIAEIAVDTGNSAWLELPAQIPDASHWLCYLSYKTNADDRGNLLAFGDTAAVDGLKPDRSNSDGFSNPAFEIPVVGVSNHDFISAANYIIGDRMNVLLSGSITGNVATTNVVIWDETSKSATLVYTKSSASTASAYGFTSGYPGQTQAIFASGGGQRAIDVNNYRFAWWNMGAVPPDITDAGVIANFFDPATGAIADPAVSHAAYGLPLYEPENTAAGMNAGTNIGSGADFIPHGTFLTV